MTSIDVRTELLLHQKFAVKKLSGLKGGLIFMEMGTGKTLTFLTLAASKVNQNKAARMVIVAPISGLSYLKEELEKHTSTPVFNAYKNYHFIPEGVKIVLLGTESLSTGAQAREFYPSIIKDAVVVLDESHLVKNPTAKRTNLIQSYAHLAKYRYISSGTPMTNGMKDIYSQARFVHPGILRYHTFEHFASNHLHRDEYGKYYGSRNIEYVTARLNPYTVRFSKKECLNLPAKQRAYSQTQPSESMLHLYNHTKEYYLNSYKKLESSMVMIYRLLTDLHKISCGLIPRFIEDNYEIINPKIDDLTAHINQIPSNESIVVWCKFLKEMDIIIPIIEKTRTVFRLDGKVDPLLRQEVISTAKNHPGCVIVATPSTGGQCIDLTFISYAVYFSNGFDYGQRIQSEDRIHRIGMQGGAHYYDIGVDLGIDKKIRRSLGNKRNFLQDFLQEIKRIQYNYKNAPEVGMDIIKEKIEDLS